MMNIKLRMYIRRIVNLLDIIKDFGGYHLILGCLLQIREQLKRKMNIIFPSAVDHGNSAKKSSQVNPRDASEVRAVEMQSFKE